MKLSNYFQSNLTNAIEPLKEMMDYLHQNVNELVSCDMTRLSGRMQGTYEDYLSQCKLSEMPQDPMEVLKNLSSYLWGGGNKVASSRYNDKCKSTS